MIIPNPSASPDDMKGKKQRIIISEITFVLSDRVNFVLSIYFNIYGTKLDFVYN